MLLAAFGIISQIKLWRVVKDRRRRSEIAAFEHQRKLRQEEEEAGRRVTQNLDRERARWEAIYGNGSRQEPSIDTYHDSSKTSSTLREKDDISSAMLELQKLRGTDTTGINNHRLSTASKRASRTPSVTVTALEEEDGIQEIDASGRPIISANARTQTPPNVFELSANSTAGSSDVAVSGQTRSSIRSSTDSPALVPPAPAVVPLPFIIPDDDNKSEENDNTSVSVVADSISDASPRRRWSKRLSGGQMLKRLSNTSSAPDEQEEALILPHMEQDRSSSIAATLDEEFDRLTMRNFSAPPSPAGSNKTIKGNAVANIQNGSAPECSEHAAPLLSGTLDTGKPMISDLTPEKEVDTGDVGAERSRTELSGPQPSNRDSKGSSHKLNMHTTSTTGKATNRTSQNSNDSPQMESAPMTPTSGNKKSSSTPTASETASIMKDRYPHDQNDLSTGSRPQPLARLSREALPHKLSKVALSYRTNEWAKHLDSAEEPDVQEPIITARAHSDYGDAQKSPVEYSDPPESNCETPLPSVLPPTELLIATEALPRPVALPAISESQPLHPNLAIRHASYNSNRLSREQSPAGTYLNRTAMRNSSMPLLAQTLEVPAPARVSNTPSPRLSSTLLDVRETLKRNMSSSPSLTPRTTSPLSSSPNLLAALDHENMTLAQRKQLIHQQKLSPPLQQWGPSSPVLASQSRPFDSHQPRRASAGVDPARREAMLAGWRESIRQEGHLGQKKAPAELEQSRRAVLLDEKRRKEIATQERAMKAQQRECAMESMMRSGQMLEAHREAMRKMQAKANRNA